MVTFPLVPGTFAKRTHEKLAFHSSVDREVEHMKQAADAESENRQVSPLDDRWFRERDSWLVSRPFGVVGHVWCDKVDPIA